MKSLKLFSLFLILLSFSTIMGQVQYRIALNGPIKFNKINFKLSSFDNPNENYFIQEFLPENDKIDVFTQKLAMHVLIDDKKIEDVVHEKIDELNRIKNKDFEYIYNITKSSDKDTIVDFLLEGSKDGIRKFVEINFYRYKQIQIAGNKRAVVIFSYTKRSYGKDIPAFLNTLYDERIKFLDQMISMKVPKVTLIQKLL